MPSEPKAEGDCREGEENHTEGVKQFTLGAMFLLTTDPPCSYHRPKSGFLSENIRENGFPPMNPQE
jgi:hypothetical protein